MRKRPTLVGASWPRQHPLSAGGEGDEIKKFAAQHRVTFVIYKSG
jgi:hypothetical protein